MRKVTTVRFLRFFACFFVRDVDFATLLNRDDTRDVFSNGHFLWFSSSSSSSSSSKYARLLMWLLFKPSSSSVKSTKKSSRARR